MEFLAGRSIGWYCTVCDEEMGGDSRPEHLAGIEHIMKEHRISDPIARSTGMELASSLEESSSEDNEDRNELDDQENEGHPTDENSNNSTPTPTPTIISNDYSTNTTTTLKNTTLENTADEIFSCTICNADILPEFKSQHLTPAWECPLCHQTFHIDDQSLHLALHHNPPSTTPSHPRQPNPQYPQNPPTTQQAIDPSTTPGNFSCSTCRDKLFPLSERKYHTGRPWTCTTCNKTMHRSKKEAHLAGRKHLNQQLWPERPQEQLGAKPEIPDEGETFVCGVCDGREFPREMWRFHNGRPWRCEVCEVSMHVRYMDAHLGGAEHRRAVRQEGERGEGGELGGGGGDDGSVHRVQDEVGFFCEVCEKMVKEKQRQMHKSIAWECTVCDATMHLGWKRRHLEGRKHTNRQEMPGRGLAR